MPLRLSDVFGEFLESLSERAGRVYCERHDDDLKVALSMLTPSLSRLPGTNTSPPGEWTRDSCGGVSRLHCTPMSRCHGKCDPGPRPVTSYMLVFESELDAYACAGSSNPWQRADVTSSASLSSRRLSAMVTRSVVDASSPSLSSLRERWWEKRGRRPGESLPRP